ncbi:Clr5 domain-containing protein [Aspergillus foveolatus]|uniref:Clr5 domain-containing protein n=1 Tax=Aspergillus foveolatus TaxID=210207 RepID=UPI003CCD0806
MVYDWDGKREICYQMYIKDRKALEEIMEYMRNVYQFSPSKRAFQTQFKRWGFPSKQNPAHKNLQLVTRVKQLWETNTSQRDMLRILNEEGFQIKERELMRVRAKNRWLLRVPNGTKAQQVALSSAQTEDDSLLALQEYQPDPQDVALSSEAALKRKERLDRLQAESAERWAARKRRRRTRGWAGLPADPPGPPRFPSETTIDESKKYLKLDNAGYRQIRDQFQSICEKAGFIKKTIAGPEKWQEAKNTLIQNSEHLQRVFWDDPDQLEAKSLALDVVCTDVTKRMRTLERRMTIAEAKNVLGINPEESRQIRNAFYNTLRNDHFTSKLEAGDEHWKELKEQWVQGSELLQRVLAPGPADPKHATKLRALEVLCRDVMKRLRDDQTKRDPSRRRQAATPSIRVAERGNTDLAGPFDCDISNGISSLASEALASAPITSSDLGDMQIDPSLLQAANNTSFTSTVHHDPGNAFGYVDSMLDSTIMPMTVYLSISPESELHADSKPWVDKLSTKSATELRQLVSARFPDSIVVKVEAFDGDTNENNATFSINDDNELYGYMAHLQGRKAVFAFCLSRG